MNRRLTLSDEDWKILADLLEEERKELHAVIHHAGRAVHEDLHARLKRVEELLARFAEPARR